MTGETNSDERPAPWWLWAVPALWAGAFLTGDRALRQLSPEAVTFARFAVAVVAGAPLLWRPVARVIAARPPPRAWASLVALSLVGGVVYHLVFYAGLRATAPPVASVIIATSPIFTALGSALVLRDRRVGAPVLAGLAAAFTGVLALASDKPGLQGGLAARLTGAWGRGESLCLAASCAWAAYVILQQRLRAGPLRALPGAGVTALHYALTAVGTLPFALRGGHLRELAAADARAWACVAYLGVASTVVAYTLYNAALERIGPARTAPVAYAVPALTTALSWALYGGAHVTWRTPLGVALVTAGLALTDGRALRALLARHG